MQTTVEIRALRHHDELARWHHVGEIPFGLHSDPALVAHEQALMPLDRTIVACEGDHFVGTAGAYPLRLTLPGGARLPVAGVTAVGVLATHRRRGILRSMMAHQLTDVAARGEAVAVLNASESGIYGRFGYGLAQRFQGYRLDPRRSGFRPEALRLAATAPPLRYVPQADATAVVAPIFDAHAAGRPGEVTRSERWWDAVLGPTESWKGGGKVFVVVAGPEADAPQTGGYVIFTTAFTAPGGRMRLTVRELVADAPTTAAALWQFLTSVDLVDQIEVEAVALDCPLRHFLADPRQVRVWRDNDYLWVRVLDVPAALSARAYGAAGTLTIDVTDRFVAATTGRYRLTVDGSGRGVCERVGTAGSVDGASGDDAADLTMDIEELGSLLLGGVRVDHLAAAGRVSARMPEVLPAATALFSWPVAPMCTTRF